MAKEKQHRVQINNKKASFEYEFLEQYDAGIVLVGTEIKSLRAGKASLQDACRTPTAISPAASSTCAA